MKEKIKRIVYGIKNTVFHFGWFIALIIPIFVILNGIILLRMQTTKALVETRLFAAAENEVHEIDLYINLQLSSIHDDINIIKGSNEVVTYLETPNASTLADYEAMLYLMAQNKSEFLRIMTIDTSGNITYQVNQGETDPWISSSGDLGTITDAYYYDTLSSISPNIIYLSKLQMVDKPYISLITPLSLDGNIQSFLRIDYDALVFLSVIALYDSSDEDYLSYSIINGNDAYEIVGEDAMVFIPYASSVADLQQQIESDPYIEEYPFQLRNISDDFYSEITGYLRIVVTMDYASAAAESDYFLLTHSWFAAIINAIVFTIISIVLHFIRIHSDDRILINANMFLTKRNEDPVIFTDNQFRITYSNDAFQKDYGYSQQEIFLKSVEQTIDVPSLTLIHELSYHAEYEGHQWNKTKSGIYVLKYLRIRKQKAILKRNEHYVGIFSEPQISFDDDTHTFITLKKQSMYELTKFFNLQPFYDERSTLILIQIENEDHYRFTSYLKRHLRDDFIITIPKRNYILIYTEIEPNQFDDLVQMLDQMLDNYRYLPTSNKQFSHMMTIACAKDDIRAMDELIDALFITTLVAKSKANIRYLVYEPNMQQQMIRQEEIKAEIEHAFSRHEFYMNYQIQQDLKTKRFVAAEALLRWKNPVLGQVSPTEFIPIIEDSFFINRLSVMVTKLVINDLTPHILDIPDDFHIAINLSNFDFSNDYMINKIINLIEESVIPTSMFIFEITESHYIDNIDNTNRIIKQLHDKNILIAIDDFGTGYSSINSLKRLDVDYVKIDRSFIMDYPKKDSGRMLKTLIELVQGLHKKIVVEGTETLEHIRFCDENHCERVQGYYVAKPLTLDQMIKQFIIPNPALHS